MADEKITALAALAAMANADLFVVVDDPSGTPVTKKITLTDAINSGLGAITDGTDTHSIKAVQEPGLGGRLSIGLDETARTLWIGDIGDIDTDHGLPVEAEPTLIISSASGARSVAFSFSELDNRRGNFNFTHRTNGQHVFINDADQSSGSFVNFISGGAAELTDDNGEQSLVLIDSKVNQTDTAAQNGLKIRITQVSAGDGTTGTGGTNNLMVAGTDADEDIFKVDLVGRVVLAESAAPAALADHAFFYAKDVGGTGEAFAADAAANEAQLTPHAFELFEPDPEEAYPWSYYAENKALGIKINVDMAGAIRAIESLTGKTFIHYEDTPKTMDLETEYRAQWEREYIRKNTTEEEVMKATALEIVETEERVLVEEGVVDKDTGEKKIRKVGVKIGEKIKGYEFVDGQVKEQIEAVWETETVRRPEIKEGVRFDTTDGKFYKKVAPSKAQIAAVMEKEFKFEPPKWMEGKL